MYNLTIDAPRPLPIQHAGLVEPTLQPSKMHVDETGLSGIPQLATMVLSFSNHLNHLVRDIDAAALLTKAEVCGTGSGGAVQLTDHCFADAAGGNTNASVAAVIESVDNIAVQTQFLSDFAPAIATRIQAGRRVAG